MGLKTVQNSSFQGLKKKTQRFVLSSVTTKSGFVATEFVVNSVVTKSSFVATSFVTAFIATKFGFVATKFVANSVGIRSGFVTRKLCHEKFWFCRNKALSLVLSLLRDLFSSPTC